MIEPLTQRLPCWRGFRPTHKLQQCLRIGEQHRGLTGPADINERRAFPVLSSFDPQLTGYEPL